MSSVTLKKVEPIHFKLGNGNFLTASHVIDFEITIQSHRFKVSAVIADNVVGLDLILGNNTLRELGGMLNFRDGSFQIKPKKVYFRPVSNVTVQPGQTKKIIVQARVPSFLRNHEVVLESNCFLAQMCPSQMLVNLRKGRTFIQVTNTSQIRKFFVRSKPVAHLNLNDVALITQDVTPEFLNFLHIAERVNSDSEVSSQQTLRQYNQEKYPHLDPHDPLLDMTEADVFSKHVNLSDSILDLEERSDFHNYVINALGLCHSVLIH
ncbi:hypothetical protein BSL78_28283 [Apostichopus japonicus]|uniref:Uncharacterized protein n=1 Tax=Stichopus japonicus TaxID=307972 RepID=A0A2G8JGM3_STIJA|nr:hypothetical protein BSL78_28283 [Apostichopus japonicus]